MWGVWKSVGGDVRKCVGEVREDVGRSVGEGVRKCVGVWGGKGRSGKRC